MRNQAKRSKRLQILVMETEQAAMEKKAGELAVSLSDYIRRCALTGGSGEVRLKRALARKLCELQDILSKKEYNKLNAWRDELWQFLR